MDTGRRGVTFWGAAIAVLILVPVLAYSSIRIDPNTAAGGGQSTNVGESIRSTSTGLTQAPHNAVAYFGDSYVAHSAILVPAHAVLWSNFIINHSGTVSGIGAGVIVDVFPSELNTNVTVALYLNGQLLSKSLATVPPWTSVIAVNVASINSTEPEGPANGIRELSYLVPSGMFAAVIYSPGIANGSVVSVAVMADRPIWIRGWSQSDLASSSSMESGHALWQIPVTYESPGQSTIPLRIPATGITLPFEMQVSGDLIS